MISTVRIIGFKCFVDFKMSFRSGVNLVVGDNDAGKTTILEAINLVMSGQVGGKSIFSEISPYIFNTENVANFISKIGEPQCRAPKIVIEATFAENAQTSRYRGINNLDRIDAPGVSIVIDLDNEYSDEYRHYISDKRQVTSVPTEFYGVSWTFFSGNPVGMRGGNLKSTYIDASSIRFASGSDRFINKVVNDTLSNRDKAQLSIEYRKLRESFSGINEVGLINKGLTEKGKIVTDKDFKISVDISAKSGWDTVLIPYLNEIPFQYIGMGEQSKLKIGFALSSTLEGSAVFLIEEPENHLSFTNMAMLIERVSELCTDKQVIISTHSTYVLNKLGIDNLHLIHKQKTITLSDLSATTIAYFKRLPGYDTLRMILSERIILVEGPTEELILQRLYKDTYGKSPQEARIDVITVRGLAFERFLEISTKLAIKTTVITDNDGDVKKVSAKYAKYQGVNTISVFFPSDPALSTLEVAIVACNDKAKLEKVLGASFPDAAALQSHLIANKTDWALKVLESPHTITFPEYLRNALN